MAAERRICLPEIFNKLFPPKPAYISDMDITKVHASPD